MISEFAGMNLGADAYSALMTTAQLVMTKANNGLIAGMRRPSGRCRTGDAGQQRHHPADRIC